MPLVRLTCSAAGRYDASRGDVIEVTDEEFARWAPEGLVEAVGVSAEEPAVAEPALEFVEPVDAPEVTVEEKRKPERRARPPKAS